MQENDEDEDVEHGEVIEQVIQVVVPSDSNGSSVSVEYKSASIQYSSSYQENNVNADHDQEDPKEEHYANVGEITPIINIENKQRVFQASREVFHQIDLAGLASRMHFMEQNIQFS